ncbi:hypothetical protein KOW79_021753 [Hemibagrus wyckioides]|uniref:Ribonuclease A-domain domain-containing protein n=1 Tax=Hemibagrus wyckioides TaxID=337641 RepID=A0A9D3S8N5_9TELE|nr:hypothetical protein KOW79_021753 [Hemibagrus wyckioides]
MMEIRVFGLVLLLVLSVALPAEAQNWESFRRKHIYLHMAEPYCTSKIKNEKINFGDTCKETHSIIKATDSQVQAICQKGGNPMDSCSLRHHHGDPCVRPGFAVGAERRTSC